MGHNSLVGDQDSQMTGFGTHLFWGGLGGHCVKVGSMGQ